MKLDPTVMRTMNRQDYRVLAAVESGMRTHALVPSPLISSLSSLRHGGTHKILSSLLRDKLLSHDRSCGYDGYRLTSSGYDVLALHNLKSRGIVSALGDRIGTGKESDVYLAATPTGRQIVLKFHRLGRTSFRDVKKKRDYFMVNAVSKNKKKGLTFKTQPNSWLFLSRISALKEFAFMKALHGVDYPTPTPLGHNRHVVVMGLIRGMPLYQVHAGRVSAEQSRSIFEQSAFLANRLARHGLVHCDLNEFNLMVDLSGVQSAIAQDDEDGGAGEHYVRHSGMSVCTKGALSAHGPLQRHALEDGTGERVTEAPPEPAELLENGEPKPIVTLIDFPQMVSTRHPNARELFERDLACLKRFFVMKLRCVPSDGEGGWEDMMPKWEELVPDEVEGGSGGAAAEDLAGAAEGAIEEEEVDDEASTCLASRAQLRLDEELKASGYSTEDAGRDVELYYYESIAHRNVGNDKDGGASDEESGDEGNSDNAIEEGDDEGEGSDGDGSGKEEHSLSDPDDDKGRKDEDEPSVAPSVRSAYSINASVVSRQSYAQAEAKARARVDRHLREQKKKGRARGAFRTRNSNKSYEKGKRVWNDAY